MLDTFFEDSLKANINEMSKDNYTYVITDGKAQQFEKPTVTATKPRVMVSRADLLQKKELGPTDIITMSAEDANAINYDVFLDGEPLENVYYVDVERGMAFVYVIRMAEITADNDEEFDRLKVVKGKITLKTK